MQRKENIEIEKKLILESDLWRGVAIEYLDTEAFPEERAQELLGEIPDTDISPCVFKRLVDQWVEMGHSKEDLEPFILPVPNEVPIYQLSLYLRGGSYPPPNVVMALNVRLASYFGGGSYTDLDNALLPPNVQGKANFINLNLQRKARSEFICKLTMWIYEHGPFANLPAAIDSYIESIASEKLDNLRELEEISIPTQSDKDRLIQKIFNTLVYSFGGVATSPAQMRAGGEPIEIGIETLLSLLRKTKPEWDSVSNAIQFQKISKAIESSSPEHPYIIDNND